MTNIIADDGIVAAVGDIDAVLIIGGQAFIVFDQDIIGKTGEDAALKTAFAIVVPHDAVVRIDQPDAIARRIDAAETVDLDIVGILDIDEIRRAGRGIDHDVIPGCDKDEGVCSGAGDSHIKTSVRAILHPYRITGSDVIFCVL